MASNRTISTDVEGTPAPQPHPTVFSNLRFFEALLRISRPKIGLRPLSALIRLPSLLRTSAVLPHPGRFSLASQISVRYRPVFVRAVDADEFFPVYTPLAFPGTLSAACSVGPVRLPATAPGRMTLGLRILRHSVPRPPAPPTGNVRLPPHTAC